MITPFDVLLDARIKLVTDPEWGREGYDGPLGRAHRFLERATSHLGIRACYLQRGITEELLQSITCEAAPEAEVKA